MLKEVGRHEHEAAAVDWPDPPLPPAAVERHRVSARLIVLALAGFVGLVVSFLAR